MLNRIRNRIVSLPRPAKRGLMALFDACAVSFALWASIAIRKGTLTPEFEPLYPALLALLLLSFPVFVRFGLYHAVIRYVSIEIFYTVLKAVTLSTLILGALIFMFHIAPFPRSSLLIYWLLTGALIGGSRLITRDFILGGKQRNNGNQKLMAIYGAGEAGHQLSQQMASHPQARPIAFIDDDPNLHGSRVNGLKVYAPQQIPALVDEQGLEQILLAMPKLNHQQRKEVIDRLEPYPIHVYTVPTIEELLSGKATVDDIREIEIDDLLGRDPVKPNAALLNACIADKVVMVTGAGGSIGSELCRQISSLQPRLLILLEANEYALYQIERELAALELSKKPEILALLGNIQDEQYLTSLMQRFRVQTVYHAAAYKHVPIVEHNIEQGVRNNIFGTLATAQACITARVETCVLISTDKAVRPTNIMGATKRFAELILQALSQQHNHTRFCMVRFGNVLGSSGSVIPVFREQIQNGGPVTVTHPEIIRYFMTIPEASQLVIQAGAMGTGGDVFVLDMGKPVKIADLAQKMIRLMGKTVKTDNRPEGEIAITYTGLRPGEKLYEELLVGENVSGTEHPMIMRAEEDALPWAALQDTLQGMQHALETHNSAQLRELLQHTITGYQPSSPLVDHMGKKTTQPSNRPALH